MDKHKVLQLARYVRSGVQNGILYFGFGSVQQAIRCPEMQLQVAEVAKRWVTPSTILEIQNHLSDLGDSKDYKPAIDFLIEHDFVKPVEFFDQSHRFSRSHLFYSMYKGNPLEIQRMISDKSVAILGCGGIGNIVSVNLATAGINRLILVDHDEIELSNLSRQILFVEDDVAKKKVDVLSHELRRRNSQLEITTQCSQISTYEDIEKIGHPDLIVLSADAGDIFNIVNHYALKNNIPYLNVGYVEDIAVFGPFVIPGVTGCMFCQDTTATVDESGHNPLTPYLKHINESYQAPSVGPVNMLASSLATLDILKYFGKFGSILSQNRRVGLWSHDLHFEYQDYQRNPECRQCGFLNNTTR